MLKEDWYVVAAVAVALVAVILFHVVVIYFGAPCDSEMNYIMP